MKMMLQKLDRRTFTDVLLLADSQLGVSRAFGSFLPSRANNTIHFIASGTSLPG
ncbi:hypothetical protein EXN66_Car018092 [Channa argus]|uniref:Uncharacterized protein n=1 Tax=Channa argus TaxID=215402 RepID=A0A6G1QIX4_CHAAH|nr:hypothetical protein EXN66_Car018092 [Channa argus]